MRERIGLTVCFLVILLVASLSLIASIAFAQPGPSEGAIQEWLKSPIVLLILMLFGSILSMVKQWGAARMDDSTVTLTSYAGHLQELFITLGGNLIAFFLLVDSGNLNFVSAISIGYVLNSAADLNPLGSRSTVLAGKE